MTGVDARLMTLRRAVMAFRDTPGRTGRFVQLQNADDVLVAGDMHGHVDNFRRVLAQADLPHQPNRHLVFQELIHGPFRYPDGTDKSHQLVDLVCALKVQFPGQVHYLIGNHELSQLTERAVMKQEGDLNEKFQSGLAQAYGSRASEIYAVYKLLFASLPFALRTVGRIFLSHSLPSASLLGDFSMEALYMDPTRDLDTDPGGSLYSLVWGRDVRATTVEGFLAKVDADLLVSGHIPCPSGFEIPSPRHLILDTQGHPAAYALLPADRPIPSEELPDLVHLL